MRSSRMASRSTTSLRRCADIGRAGREWLEELEISRDPWFNINVGDGFYHYHRCVERRPVDAVRGAAGLHAPACRPASRSSARSSGCSAERKQLIEDYRELLATDEERAAYDQMITLAHRVFPYVEGHKFYCEHWYTNLFFNKIREFGALLAAHGFFAERGRRVPPHALRARSRRSST